jgi:hypothetical protein
MHLDMVMDEYHTHFDVYKDISSGGNHFHARQKFPNGDSLVRINGSATDMVHEGATSTRITWEPAPGAFAGWLFNSGTLAPAALAPMYCEETDVNCGAAVGEASVLSFWAKGRDGGEVVEFVVRGGTAGVNSQTFTLTKDWMRYEIPTAGRDLSRVINGFGVSALNAGGKEIWVDDIQFELSEAVRLERLAEPRFLRSFTTLPLQPDVMDPNNMDDDIDLVLRNAAFAYDNAVAGIAELFGGSVSNQPRHKLIGDAFVYANNHDRRFDDGRIRTAYMAGDIALPLGWTPNGRPFTTPVAGFYKESTQQFIEIEQEAVDVGNSAWSMIFLLALHRKTGDAAYLTEARRIGNFIRTFRNDSPDDKYRGFQGGINNPEPVPPAVSQRRPWASTEHNLDIYAAFDTMHKITGEAQWGLDRDHARQFIEAMWDADQGAFRAGTTDPDTRNENPDQLPLDAQTWALLALHDTLSLPVDLLSSIEQHFATTDNGFSGFDFNTDKDGVWFEGTAQAALAYNLAGESAKAQLYLEQLRNAQRIEPLGDGKGIPASTKVGLTTGFLTPSGMPFKYYPRLHIGATAWAVFADLGINPYYAVPGNVRVPEGVTLTVDFLRDDSLELTANSKAVIRASDTDSALFMVKGLSINGPSNAPLGTLDLTNNAGIIDYGNEPSPQTVVRQQIIAGRGGVGLGNAHWNGKGITSSSAQSANALEPEARSVGYAENATLPLGLMQSFRGQMVDDTSVLLAFTITGDANLDGVVNDDDVTIVGATYAPGVSQARWDLGDFDYNGFVDDDDVTLLGAFYNPPGDLVGAVVVTAAVPEPSTLTIVVIGLAILVGKRRAKALGSRRTR